MILLTLGVVLFTLTHLYPCFAAAHRERGWFLEARDYGLMGGILAGDLCLSFSEALFAPLCAGADPAATTGPRPCSTTSMPMPSPATTASSRP